MAAVVWDWIETNLRNRTFLQGVINVLFLVKKATIPSRILNLLQVLSSCKVLAAFVAFASMYAQDMEAPSSVFPQRYYAVCIRHGTTIDRMNVVDYFFQQFDSPDPNPHNLISVLRDYGGEYISKILDDPRFIDVMQTKEAVTWMGLIRDDDTEHVTRFMHIIKERVRTSTSARYYLASKFTLTTPNVAWKALIDIYMNGDAIQLTLQVGFRPLIVV